MTELTTKRRPIGFSPELKTRINEYRYSRRIPAETKAIRELIELGLEAAAQGTALKEAA